MKRTTEFELPDSTKAEILALLGLAKRPTMKQHLLSVAGALGLPTLLEAIRTGLALLFAPYKTPRPIKPPVGWRQAN